MNLGDLVPWRSRERELSRSESSDPITSLQRDMNRLFNRFWEDTPEFTESMTGFHPTVDFSETDDEYVVSAELPGIDDKDVDVSMEQGYLTIQGEKKEETEREDGYYERSYGRFRRSIPIPSDINEKKIEAYLDKGVLSIRLPKSEEAKKDRKQIPLKVS